MTKRQGNAIISLLFAIFQMTALTAYPDTPVRWLIGVIAIIFLIRAASYAIREV